MLESLPFSLPYLKCYRLLTFETNFSQVAIPSSPGFSFNINIAQKLPFRKVHAFTYPRHQAFGQFTLSYLVLESNSAPKMKL